MEKKKVIQGTYISLAAKQAIIREAKRKEIFATTLASEILEKAVKKIIRQELYGSESSEEVKSE
jgi:hypothetical protein